MLRNCSFELRPGGTTLLLGPNGAGKSTLMRLIAGLHRPSRGTISIAGAVRPRDLFEHVAWMPQSISPVRHLTVRQQVAYAGWLAGLESSAAESAADEAIDTVRLSEKANEPARQLSGGQMRRLGLAQTLVRRSDVILLDEPTAGLDPAQARHFTTILDELDPLAGLLVSTHQVADLTDSVDWVLTLIDGRVVFDGSVDQFRSSSTRLGARDDTISAVFEAMMSGGLH